jgi:DNA-binding winged helix-turn-helix (wHTH) protein/WD40 repeat protein
MDKFYLQNVLVDPSRNQICHGEHCELIEPKAMSLLCVLAKHPNKVLSQETLIENIWQNRVFSPSALQRLVALLRKALKDDPKNARFIRTHAKRGYSLEVVPEYLKEATAEPSTQQNKLIALLLVSSLILLLVGTVIFQLFSKPFDSTLELSKVASLTHSTNSESRGQLSFDAKKLLFMQQKNGEFELVLKEIGSEQSHILLNQTKPMTFLWLNDSQIVSTYNNPKNEALQLKLLTIENNIAISEKQLQLPQNTRFIEHIYGNGDGKSYLILTQVIKDQTSNALAEFDAMTNRVQILTLLPNDTHIHSLTASKNSLFITATQSQTIQQLFLFDLNSETLSLLKDDLSSIYHLAWHEPSQQLLLFDTLKAEGFSIDDSSLGSIPHSQADLKPIKLNIEVPLSQVMLRNEQLVATLFSQNIDIFSNQPAKFNYNSKYEDYLASVSSDGEMVAFISQKHGKPMLFLKQGEQLDLIFKNNENSDFISKAIWSPNNQAFAFAASGKAFLYNIASKQLEELASNAFIVRIDYWQDSKNTLFATARQENTSVTFNLDTFSNQAFHQQGVIIFKDENQKIIWHDDAIFNLQENKKWQLDKGDIVHAFVLQKHILVHVRDQSANNYLVKLSKNLKELSKISLMPTVGFVSSAYFDNKSNGIVYFYSHWLEEDADVILSNITTI